ncbi:MAG TPA: SDR family oxidoreductase [Steroidobacteraceae bacterium]|nr:SDR family oxidoreductase [Steroidobacteraceae bacterium]
MALITGAAQGIGRCIALTLGARGYALALNDVRAPTDTLTSLHAAGCEAIELVGDVADERTTDAGVERIVSRWGRLDVLVNNAGVSCIRRAQETSPEQFRRVLEINLVGAFIAARTAGKVMLAQRAGSIINIASIAGLVGIADRVAYNASKHGLIGMTRTLAAEWGGHGVRCNAVCPGWVKTEMDAADQAGGSYRDADIIDRVPMGRFASPADIANAVSFLADPAASGFINGQAIAVDGGWTADGSWQSLRLQHR